MQAVRGKKLPTDEDGSTSGDDLPSKKQRRDACKSELDGMVPISAALRGSDEARFALERENWSSREKRHLRKSQRGSKTELRN